MRAQPSCRAHCSPCSTVESPQVLGCDRVGRDRGGLWAPGPGGQPGAILLPLDDLRDGGGLDLHPVSAHATLRRRLPACGPRPLSALPWPPSTSTSASATVAASAIAAAAADAANAVAPPDRRVCICPRLPVAGCCSGRTHRSRTTGFRPPSAGSPPVSPSSSPSSAWSAPLCTPPAPPRSCPLTTRPAACCFKMPMPTQALPFSQSCHPAPPHPLPAISPPSHRSPRPLANSFSRSSARRWW